MAFDDPSVRRATRWAGGTRFSDGEVVMIALAAVVGVWTRSAVRGSVRSALRVDAGLAAELRCLLTCLVDRRRAAGGVRRSSWDARRAAARRPLLRLGTIVGDPAPFGSGLRVTVEVGGERFDAWAYGSPRRRLVDRQAGEKVFVQGNGAADDVAMPGVPRSVTSSAQFDLDIGRRLARRVAAVPHVVARAHGACAAPPSRRWAVTMPRCSPVW